MPDRALRPPARRRPGPAAAGLNASNARQGIKTDSGGREYALHLEGLNASNARQGIKTSSHCHSRASHSR